MTAPQTDRIHIHVKQYGVLYKRPGLTYKPQASWYKRYISNNSRPMLGKVKPLFLFYSWYTLVYKQLNHSCPKLNVTGLSYFPLYKRLWSIFHNYRGGITKDFYLIIKYIKHFPSLMGIHVIRIRSLRDPKYSKTLKDFFSLL